MLRLLHDRFIVSIGQVEVQLFRQRNGNDVIELIAEQTIEEQRIGLHSSHLSAFEAVIKKQASVRYVEIALQDSLAVYATLPWSDVSLTAAEYRQLAEIRLQELHSLDVADWAIEIRQEFEKRGLLCAVRHDLIVGLATIARQYKLKPAIRPALSSFVEQVRIPQVKESWMLVDVTACGILLAMMGRQGWVSVRYVKHCRTSSQEDNSSWIYPLVRRECYLLGIDRDCPIYIRMKARVDTLRVAELLEDLVSA